MFCLAAGAADRKYIVKPRSGDRKNLPFSEGVLVGAPTAATTNAEDEIKKLEQMRNEAVLHGDVSVLDRMTSDDFTFVTPRGEMRTKQEILKGFASGSFHYDSRRSSI